MAPSINCMHLGCLLKKEKVKERAFTLFLPGAIS